MSQSSACRLLSLPKKKTHTTILIEMSTQFSQLIVFTLSLLEEELKKPKA